MTVPYDSRKELKTEKPAVAAKLLREAFDYAREEVKNTGFRPVGGCGRVYVDLGRMRANSRVLKALSGVGKMFNRPFFKYRQLYVGYDNATGKEWQIGKLIAEYLNDRGYHAYVDGDGD